MAQKLRRPPTQVVSIFSAGGRPYPPKDLTEPLKDGCFVPTPDLRMWMETVFIAERGILANEEHAHLRTATLGVLWTNRPNSRQQRRIVGQAEIMPPQGGSMGKWARGRLEQQITEWFGSMPDFLLTFDATYAAECDDATFCALVEHELYHCGQEHDIFGMPKFRRDGTPAFAMRGHDVEEFVGVVRRYGAGASNAGPLAEAARKPPEIAEARIVGACGTCLRAAA